MPTPKSAPARKQSGAQPRKPRGRTGALTPYQRRSDGRWLIEVPVPNGRPRTVSGKTAAEARAKLPDLLIAIREGTARRRPVKGATVRQVLSAWLAAKKPTVAANTFDGYVLQARHLKPIHHIVADDLTRNEVRDLLAAHRAAAHAPTSVNALLNALRMAFRWAADEEPPLTTNSSAPRAELYKVDKEPPVPLHTDDVRRILAMPVTHRQETQRKDEAMVLIGTGCRTGELLGIRKQDWDGTWLSIEQQIRRV